MSDVNLGSEWTSAAWAAKRSDFDCLIAKGVPGRWLWSGPMRFGTSGIVTFSDATYCPRPDDGQPAVIVPAFPMADDELFECQDAGDLIAFSVAEPGRWWRRLGTAPILNQVALQRAGWLGGRLSVRRNPLDWLRAAGDGVVILDAELYLPHYIADVEELVVQDIEFGEELERRLTVRTATPRILVAQDGDAHE